MPRRDKYASPYGKPAAKKEESVVFMPMSDGTMVIIDELFEVDRTDHAIHSTAGKMTQLYERRRKERVVVNRYGDAW